MQTAEKARQKSVRHAHINHRAHISSTAQEMTVYLALSLGINGGSAKASAVAVTGENSRAGTLFSRLPVTPSFITANR